VRKFYEIGPSCCCSGAASLQSEGKNAPGGNAFLGWGARPQLRGRINGFSKKEATEGGIRSKREERIKRTVCENGEREIEKVRK